MNRAEQKLEPGGWSVYFDGRRVLAGESYVVASNIEAGLNGQRVEGECAEVVRSILSADDQPEAAR